MKTQKNKLKIKKIVAISFIILVLVLMYSILAFFANAWPFNNSGLNKKSLESNEIKTNQIDLNKPTQEQIDAGKDIKKDATQSENDGDFDAFIIDITQKNDVLLINTLIQDITNEGVCKLTISDGSNQFETAVGISAMPTTSSCKDFGIVISRTGLKFGKWQFRLSVTIDEKTVFFETEKIIEKV